MLIRSLLVLALVFVSGCCVPRKHVGDGNIPVAEGDGPLADVFFGFDSYALTTDAKATLKGNADWLMANAGNVQIEGHCDERGTNEYNMALGANRANAVMEYLVGSGVGADRMTTVSYGEELPLDPGHNEVAWAKNRRAHHKVVSK